MRGILCALRKPAHLTAPFSATTCPAMRLCSLLAQVLLQKTSGVAHRPGSVKKQRAQPVFGGAAARSNVTDRVVQDVGMAMHPNRRT